LILGAITETIYTDINIYEGIMRIQVFNSKKLFEVGNYIYECNENEKKQNKWYWHRKNSAKKIPVYELNQYGYNVEVIRIYKGAIYFKANDFEGNLNFIPFTGRRNKENYEIIR